MTESEWLTSTLPIRMVKSLCGTFGAARRKGGRRKLRLFACACCRHVWHKLEEERDRDIVLVAERLADGLASPEEVNAAQKRRLERDMDTCASVEAALATTHAKPRAAAQEVTFHVCCVLAGHGTGYQERWRAEREAQASLLREVFGNPYRPLALDRRWVTSSVVTIAQAIYEDRAFGDLPVLADALEEAGCDSADFLSHLRGPGPHVRGCWALDLVLGKG